MATVRRKSETDAAGANVGRWRSRASAGKDVVQSFAGGIDQVLHAKRVAGLPYSTLNARGEVVLVHPDGTVRTGRAADSPAVG